MTSRNLQKKVVLFFALAIIFSIAVTSSSFGEETYGFFIVTDSKDKNIDSIASSMMNFVKQIRTYNNMTPEDLPLRYCDMGNPEYLPYCRDILKVEKSWLPFIGLATLKSNKDFDSFPAGMLIKNVTNPRQAVEMTMKQFGEKLPPDRRQKFRYTLFTGFKFIKSTPSEAEVSINGARVGKTPLENVSVGDLQCVVSVSKESYRTVSRNVTFQFGEIKELELNLDQLKGSLAIVSVPEKAEVFIDNTPAGKTPLTLTDIIAGQHTILLKKDDYRDCQATITVKENETTAYNFTLKKAKLSYSLTATSNEVEFTVKNPLTHRFETKTLEVNVRSFISKFQDVLNKTGVLEKSADPAEADLSITIEMTPTEQMKADISVRDIRAGKVVYRDSLTTARPLPGSDTQLADTFVKLLTEIFIPKLVTTINELMK